VDNPPSAPLSGKRIEIGVRPEFVSLAKDGIPVRIVRVSDAGRHRVVDARHGDIAIKLLVDESVSVPGEVAHVRFDPARTRLYADGWLVE
jgi:glycerol transport system ATP-binding protein